MSRRGYLLVLEQGSSHWTRRFVVVRRPYLLFYRSARDPIERSIINLATAVVEYSADKQVRFIFRHFSLAYLYQIIYGNFTSKIRTFSERPTFSPFLHKHVLYYLRLAPKLKRLVGYMRLIRCWRRTNFSS